MAPSSTDTILSEIWLGMENENSMFVCTSCVQDDWIRNLATGLVKPRTCSGCGKVVEEAQTPVEIASIIRGRLQEYFIVDYGLHPGYEMSLPTIVGKAIRCESDAVCSAIAELLVDHEVDEDEFYSPGQEYSLAPSKFDSEEHERWWAEGDWHAVSYELTHGRRFFNDKAKVFFNSLIREAMGSRKDELSELPSAVKMVPAGSLFYRARVAQNLSEVIRFQGDPEKELGAPPRERAANNRMSAAGIPLMYVAGDSQTCIAEVRPSIGDQVVVAEFVSTENLKFFDFTALRTLEHSPLSLFSPSFSNRADRRLLLGYLHDLIARPVRASDTDYVMTQALAECIRYSAHGFDGIAFRSVQRSDGGINYVLFDKTTSAQIRHPDQMPEFSLGTSPENVSVHLVKGVTYQTEALP